MRLQRMVTFAICGLFLGGCSQLMGQPSQVRHSHHHHYNTQHSHYHHSAVKARDVVVSYLPATGNCQFKGNVTGKNGSAILGQFTSNDRMSYRALQALRCKAAYLGANRVVVQTNQTPYAQDQFVMALYTGKAYYCH